MAKINGKEVYGNVARLLAAADKEMPPLMKARGCMGTPLVDSLKAVVSQAKRSGRAVEDVELPPCPLGIMAATRRAVDGLLDRPADVRHVVGKRAGRDILSALRDVRPELDKMNTMIAIEMTTIH